MNFNGKYWHKPGHLGMTTDEVKKALKALPTPEAGDAGKAVLVNADADGYELGTAGGGGGFTILSSVYDEVQDKDYLTYLDGSFVLAKDVDKVFTPFTVYRRTTISSNNRYIEWDLLSITTKIVDDTELIDYGTLLIKNQFFRIETLGDPNSKIEFYSGD